MENAVRKLQDHRRLYTIGQVLTVLKPEFGDLSPSKLRFLEDQGLVTPERTDAGYRKYSENQIERLRVVLTLQRDQYLPLRVIKDYLEELRERQEEEAAEQALADENKETQTEDSEEATATEATEATEEETKSK